MTAKRFECKDPEGQWIAQMREEYDRNVAAHERMTGQHDDTRALSDEQFEEYVSDAYADDWAKAEGMRQMRDQGHA